MLQSFQLHLAASFKLLLCRSFLKDLIQVVKVNVAGDVATSILINAASSLPKPTITESLLLTGKMSLVTRQDGTNSFQLFMILCDHGFELVKYVVSPQSLSSVTAVTISNALQLVWKVKVSISFAISENSGLLNSPKTKMIYGIMLVVFPFPFVQVSL